MSSHLITFCQDYLTLGVEVARLGRWFLIAALALGVGYAAAELWQRLKPAPAGGGGLRGRITGLDIKTLADALRELVVTLATAPVWLALMAVGLLTFALVGLSVPEPCGLPEKQQQQQQK